MYRYPLENVQKLLPFFNDAKKINVYRGPQAIVVILILWSKQNYIVFSSYRE